jgi:hypothetical protein
MAAYVSKPRDVLVYLFNPTLGAPMVGVPFDGVSVHIKKPMQGIEAWIISEDSWIPLGDGFYSLIVPGNMLMQPGEFHWWLTSPDSAGAHGSFEVDALPLEASIPPGQCLVSGSVVSLGGMPKLGALVSLRVVKTPTTVSGSLLEGNILQTYTTATGQFSLPVVQGVTAILEITSAGIRQQVIIPHLDSVDVLTLLPPIAP